LEKEKQRRTTVWGGGRTSEFFSPMFQRRVAGCLLHRINPRGGLRRSCPRRKVTGVTRTEEFCRNLHVKRVTAGSNVCQKQQSMVSKLIETVVRRVLVGIWIRKGKSQTFGREGSPSTASDPRESASLRAGLRWFVRAVRFPDSLPKFFRNSS